MKRAAVSCILAIVVAGPLSAQQAQPDCSGPEHRQFDFWAGDWEVTDSAGATVYGSNVITREELGCALRERWTGSRGGTGQSLNFFDRTTGRWSQVWVASNGNVLRLEGGLSAGAMSLEGESRTATGEAVRNRIVWTPQPDGRVRQTWFVSRGGASWQASFDGWYRRR